MTLEASYHTLFRRCVQCPPVVPSCPRCKDDEVCTQISQSCDACARTECVEISVSGATTVSRSRSKPNVGGIVGGVIGGLVAFIILTYLIWRFVIKKRRIDMVDGGIAGSVVHMDDGSLQEKEGFAMTPSTNTRNSTHTVVSMASTAMTRASNVIQIAYIPGVTNRQGGGPNSPEELVPPVPRIPAAAADMNSLYSPQPDQHFFVPAGLRDSTFSGLMSDGRESIAPSLARSSVATTIYGNHAVLDPMPAQTIVRGKAAVISVKPSPAGTPGTRTPRGQTSPLRDSTNTMFTTL